MHNNDSLSRQCKRVCCNNIINTRYLYIYSSSIFFSLCFVTILSSSLYIPSSFSYTLSSYLSYHILSSLSSPSSPSHSSSPYLCGSVYPLVYLIRLSCLSVYLSFASFFSLLFPPSLPFSSLLPSLLPFVLSH